MSVINPLMLLCVAGALLGSGCASSQGMTRLKPKNDPELKRSDRVDITDTAGGARPAIIAAARVHSVKKGETLSTIASAYGTSEEKLAEVNKLSNPKQLRVGQKLQIPDPYGAVAPTFPASTPAIPLPGETVAPF
jgi:LysM repeat protein